MNFSIFLSLLFFYSVVQAQMIRVSSTLYDAAKQEEQTIEGVGSLISAEGKFYVLTVGHVSLGQNLQLLGDQGSTFQALNRYDDFENDLTLIEVQPSEQQIELYLLAMYGERRSLKGKGLLMNLVSSFIEPDRKTDWKVSILTRRKYRSFIVDQKGLIDSISQDPDYDRVKYWPAEILLASWLTLYSKREWQQLIDRHLLKWKDVPRSTDAKNFELDIPFLPGYSGSPILIHHGSTATSMTPPYTLGGVVTLSNRDSDVSSSHVVGPKMIHRLLETAVRGQKSIGIPSSWFLLDGLFAKLGQELTVFRYDGPIGNGIAPTGKSLDLEKSGFDEKNQKNLVIQHLERRMQNQVKTEPGNIQTDTALRELSVISQEKDIDSQKLLDLSKKMQIQLRIK